MHLLRLVIQGRGRIALPKLLDSLVAVVHPDDDESVTKQVAPLVGRILFAFCRRFGGLDDPRHTAGNQLALILRPHYPTNRMRKHLHAGQGVQVLNAGLILDSLDGVRGKPRKPILALGIEYALESPRFGRLNKCRIKYFLILLYASQKLLRL